VNFVRYVSFVSFVNLVIRIFIFHRKWWSHPFPKTRILPLERSQNAFFQNHEHLLINQIKREILWRYWGSMRVLERGSKPAKRTWKSIYCLNTYRLVWKRKQERETRIRIDVEHATTPNVNILGLKKFVMVNTMMGLDSHWH